MDIKSVRNNQRGIATLFTAIFLLLVSSILIFAVARSTVTGKKNVGDELRIQEAYQAAEAGLEYGLEQLKLLGPGPIADGGLGIGDLATNFQTDPNPPSFTPAGTGNTYNTTVTYTRMVDADPDANRDKPIFLVSSTAQPVAGDTHIQRTVSTLVLRSEVFGSGLGATPPILLEGSMTNTGGSGDIVPGPDGVGVTSLGDNSNSIDLIESNPSSAEAHGGSASYSDGQTALSQMIFGTDLTGTDLDDFVRDLAQDNPNIIFYDYAPSNIPDYPSSFDDPLKLASLNGQPPVIDIDDPDNFYLVYFATQDSGGNPICPKLNGGFHLIGLLYVASEGGSGAGQCDSMGFGNCHVYGTIAFTGDLNKFNANCQIIGLDFTGSGGSPLPNPASLSAIPGTWRDFQ